MLWEYLFGVYRLKHYKWNIVIVKLRVLVHWTTIKLYLPQQTLVGESNIGLGVQAFRSRVLEKNYAKTFTNYVNYANSARVHNLVQKQSEE